MELGTNLHCNVVVSGSMSYEEVDPTNTEWVERGRKTMVGHFLSSRNYFSLNLEQLY